MPQFAPEAFRILRAQSLGKYRAFRKGLEQLSAEGVVQILRKALRGEAAPVMAAVGPMQFEVVTARMKAEFNVDTIVEPLGYSIARRTDEASAPELNRQRGVEAHDRHRHPVERQRRLHVGLLTGGAGRIAVRGQLGADGAGNSAQLAHLPVMNIHVHQHNATAEATRKATSW